MIKTLLIVSCLTAIAKSVDPIGWCDMKATENACKKCYNETSCGGQIGNTTFCWAQEDPDCTP